MIHVWPSPVREDASALVVFTGLPNTPVAWSLTGPGTLTPIHEVTTDAGCAAARYVPGSGTAGSAATISCIAGE